VNNAELVLALDAGVLTLTLNRPEKRNALSWALINSFADAISDATDNRDVKVIVVTGAGSAFCAGADLVEIESLSPHPRKLRQMLHSWNEAFRAMERCPKPVLAAVNGVAIAGGLELALAADVIVASSAARFGDGHIIYGMVPGGGGSVRLPTAIGARRARWLMYTGVLLDSAQAERAGLVQLVVAERDFSEEVRATAVEMTSRSTVALSFMKRMTAERAVTDELLQFELEAAAHLLAGPHAREGLAAFRARRKPVFPDDASGWRS
jgi:enoyl-CoA hydratase/carnithine racemase